MVVRERLGLSERRSCRVLGQARSTQHHRPKVRPDEARLIARIIELARQHGRYGDRRITALLRREGWRVNAKWVERIWRQEGPKVPKKQPERGRLWLDDDSCIRPDNGSEFTAKAVREWLGRLGVETLFIERGNPRENGYDESFNGKLRDEFLNGEISYTLTEAKVLIERWRQEYNTIQPHRSLGYRPPAPEAWRLMPPASPPLQRAVPDGLT